MKHKNKILIITLLGLLVSCESPLDKGPLGIISENVVWADQNLIDTYLGDLYNRCDFNSGEGQSDIGLSAAEPCAGGYCRTFGPWPTGYAFTKGLFTAENGTGAGNVMEYWKYDLVRDINSGIEKLEDPENTLDEDYKDAALGELHWLRAFVYLEMVKRYGGLPIIKKPQSIDEPKEDLFLPRNSEEECYDFIAEECDLAESLLEGKKLDYGRATSWAALALKSRAMLYAGSIGEFGTMQLNGLLGISNADKFWQLSYDASKKIIDNGPFALYDANPDPERNYYELFTSAERNVETILAEVFDGEGSKAENWERWAAPALVDGTTFFNIYLETFELYERIDGSPGTVNRDSLVAGIFHDLADFIGKKDPRCRADIFTPECQYLGKTVYMHEGMYIGGKYYTTDSAGLDIPSKGPVRDIQRTGMFCKKRSNEQYDVHSVQHLGGTDYMVFRLGEIYLNLAEAAYALGGKDAEALDALNTVRRRADMPDKTTIDWPIIQNERAVELAFERHRYWDLRRWRIAETVLSSASRPFTGVVWRKDYSNPGMYEIIHTTTGAATDGWPRIFLSHHYYFPISQQRTQENTALVENPGY
ncbi:RagB/SusD family nutrient uptake outer membrane protein [Bacteroidota bacterium]